MAKKKGGKKKGGGGAAGGGPLARAENVPLEFPPPLEQMAMLYRKANFDVLSPGAAAELSDLVRMQQDRTHRSVAPAYAQFLRERRFWMNGDEVPSDAIPKPPADAAAAGGKDKDKKGGKGKKK